MAEIKTQVADMAEIKAKQLVLEKKMDIIIQLLQNKSGSQPKNSEANSSDLLPYGYETPMAPAETTPVAPDVETPLEPVESTVVAVETAAAASLESPPTDNT